MDKKTRPAKVKRQLKLSPTQIIALVFAGIIVLGTVLLSLPIASRDGVSCGFRPALFTATSSTCVTGLILFDTWTQWSSFGQIVILSLIEIGGLGFMSAASLVIFLFRRKMGLRQKMLIAQALSVNEMEGVVRLQKWVLLGSLTIQFTGAMILFLRFLPEYGLEQSVKYGVFHAISAFCNAGFDITGNIQPGANMIVFNDDPVVLFTLMALIIIGGLGFFVWEDVATTRNFKKFSVYTKLVLTMSAVLILTGAVLFCLLEWNNPDTLGNMSPPQKILNAFFQSVTLRTAGFTSVDQAALSDGSKAVGIILMLIGGSSGSTAGGIKTVTFLVLMLFVFNRARGKNTVTVFRRNVAHEKIMDAATIVALVVGLAMAGAVFITATSPVGFTDALYETASALATVGLTAGATTSLSVPAQYMIILFMYFGRVGILTISLGFLTGNKAEERFHYADTNLLIG
ncbi:MAG: potassium uptake protein, TrkH family [Oscillospiraceae bacterium]|nr:potassium uptake protein, TrkH family [Oscillospiraceae bacterium]